MKTNGQITRIANGIYKEARAGINTFAEAKKSLVKGIGKKSADERIAIVSEVLEGIDANMVAPRVDGFHLPAHLVKYSYSEDAVSSVDITIRSKLKADVKYVHSATVQVDEDIVENAAQVYFDALFELFYITEAHENVVALNEKLAQICAEKEIPYTVSFAVKPEDAAMVLEIDNDHVTFNASVSDAHEIASLGIFQSGDGYNDMICEEATKKLVDSLLSCQTTVQVVKGNIELVKEVTGKSTKKRANKLIRESYHRQASNLKAVKSGVGYFSETVKIDGEDVDIFALVEKAEDGKLSVILNPFDTKTLFTVKYDVLKAIK